MTLLEYAFNRNEKRCFKLSAEIEVASGAIGGFHMENIFRQPPKFSAVAAELSNHDANCCDTMREGIFDMPNQIKELRI
jgi:hypothetical protein